MRCAAGMLPGTVVLALASCCALSGCGETSSQDAGTPRPLTATGSASVAAPAPSGVRPSTVKRQARSRCRGRTPAAIRARYLPLGRRMDIDPGLLKLASDPPSRLRGADPAAGLAAAVY